MVKHYSSIGNGEIPLLVGEIPLLVGKILLLDGEIPLLVGEIPLLVGNVQCNMERQSHCFNKDMD